MVKSFLALRAMSRPGVRDVIRLRLTHPWTDFHTRLPRVAAVCAMSHSQFAKKSLLSRPVSPGGNTMIRFWRSLAWTAAALAPFCFGVAAAPAQTTYPDHPVKIIVPIGAGGSQDLVGRHPVAGVC